MGSIDHCFNAPRDVEFDAWVETGTFGGGSARWMAANVSPIGITIDAVDFGYRQEGVTFLLGDSTTMLAQALDRVSGRVAFWLDAHYPHYYTDQPDGITVLPLQQELDLIRAWQARDPANEAWIWMDDARIYGYEAANGPLPSDLSPGEIDFFPWIATHRLSFSTRDEGYMILTPSHTP